MGNFFTRPIDELVEKGLTVVDAKIVEHHVRNGGCIAEFGKAIRECNHGGEVDVEACVGATAALRRCFAGNPGMFGHQYLWRLDKGLDQDLAPSSQAAGASKREFRWWTGMRRS